MNEKEIFLGTARVLERYGISDSTIRRWVKDDGLSFPRPLVRRNRWYFRLSELEAWEREKPEMKMHG